MQSRDDGLLEKSPGLTVTAFLRLHGLWCASVYCCVRLHTGVPASLACLGHSRFMTEAGTGRLEQPDWPLPCHKIV